MFLTQISVMKKIRYMVCTLVFLFWPKYCFAHNPKLAGIDIFVAFILSVISGLVIPFLIIRYTAIRKIKAIYKILIYIACSIVSYVLIINAFSLLLFNH